MWVPKRTGGSARDVSKLYRNLVRLRLRLHQVLFFDHEMVGLADVGPEFRERLALAKHAWHFFQLADLPALVFPILKGKMSNHSPAPSPMIAEGRMPFGASFLCLPNRSLPGG